MIENKEKRERMWSVDNKEDKEQRTWKRMEEYIIGEEDERGNKRTW